MLLLLKGGAGGARNLSLRAARGSNACGTSFAYSVLLDAQTPSGALQGMLTDLPATAPGQAVLPLPEQLWVVAPPLLRLPEQPINVSSDRNAFAVPVELTLPAPRGGVRVELAEEEPGALQAWRGAACTAQHSDCCLSACDCHPEHPCRHDTTHTHARTYCFVFHYPCSLPSPCPLPPLHTHPLTALLPAVGQPCAGVAGGGGRQPLRLGQTAGSTTWRPAQAEAQARTRGCP